MEEKEIFVIIATFQYSQDAQVIASKLESRGISIFLEDEFTVDVDPFASNAIGGVKLKVPAGKKDEARAIVAESHPEVLTHEVTCPDCKKSILRLSPSLSNFIKQLFPFSDKRKYTCENCKHQFYSDKL